MGSVLDYSTTPASNSTIEGTSIAEGCAPQNINDAIRADMALVAKFVHAITGEKVTAGTADAQTLTTGFGWSSLASMIVAFEAGVGLTNTGAMTLNVDGLGAQAVKVNGSDPAAGAITAGNKYLAIYNSSTSVWALLNPTASNLYQPLSATLTSLASASANGVSLVQAVSYAAMRALLDLEAGTDFYSKAAADAAFQAASATLTSLASASANGVSLATAANYAAMRALLDLEAGTDFAAVPSSGQLPVGSIALLSYNNINAVADGGTAAGSQLTLVMGDLSGMWIIGTAQTGTWTNISGQTMDSNGTYRFGYWQRTA